jgi:hypothetical protein
VPDRGVRPLDAATLDALASVAEALGHGSDGDPAPCFTPHAIDVVAVCETRGRAEYTRPVA